MDRDILKLMSIGYTIESEGHFLSEPIVELYCRWENDDGDFERRKIEVEGFYPYFFVEEEEFSEIQDSLMTDHMVREVVTRESAVNEENMLNAGIRTVDEPPRRKLDHTPVAKVYAVKPQHVKTLRDYFEWKGEADVFFTNRFLVDSGIHHTFSVPSTGEDRFDISEIEAVNDEDKFIDVSPRMLTVDIEVYTGGEFPEPKYAAKPITSITSHNSADDEYLIQILHPDHADVDESNSWDEYGEESIEWELPDGISMDQCEFRIYDNEADMEFEWVEWAKDCDPDILTGWNSSRNEIGNGFDYPYMLNRCSSLGVWTVSQLSPKEKCFVTNSGVPVCDGREMFDMLQAYKKTQIHEKRSYALGAIAEEELGYGKEDIEDLDEGWLHNPVEFIKYNIRDTQAVVLIEESQDVLNLYDHIRSVAGATYSECADSNIGIIDILFLRQAKMKGIALPTSEAPDRGWYYGGKVYNPSPGKHKNAVYPDLASLYPYLMWSLNVSPETMYESKEELAKDGYSVDDCYTAYVDYRDDSVKKDSKPDTSVIYFLKPSVKTGFVREVVDDIVNMKYEYKGLGKKYEAVKRIANSVYGVFGDSSSYGKGFRLFDWRLAESITIAGQMVLDFTANDFIDNLHSMGYHDAELIGGDTDSVITTIPSAQSRDEVLEASFTAANQVNKNYDEYMSETFNINDPDAHKMEVEIESYAESIFFLRDFKSNDPEDGVKKRYSQLVTWDEGEVIEDPDPKTKGFELVRSDSSTITVESQGKVLEIILREDDPRDSVRSYLKSQWEEASNGDVELEDIGIPSSINGLWSYGWSRDKDTGDINYYTPQPHIRGARYADAYITGENMDNAKPLFFYCDGVDASGDYPTTFDYPNKMDAPDGKNIMKEQGREVDAVAVEDVRRIPNEIRIDYEKMAEKTLRNPIEPIVKTMGWDFDELVSEAPQSSLGQFM